MESSLLSTLTIFRGVLLALMMVVSVICIAIGLVIFWRQSRFILGEKEEVAGGIDEKGINARFKTATGFGLIVVGLFSGHGVLRTPIDVKVLNSGGSYGLGAIWQNIITPAFADSKVTSASIRDFCDFTLSGYGTVSEVQGADGSSLSLQQDRLLHALNKIALGEIRTEQAPFAAIGEAVATDRAVARHMRYVLVQSALPKQVVIKTCQSLKNGNMLEGDLGFLSIKDKLEN